MIAFVIFRLQHRGFVYIQTLCCSFNLMMTKWVCHTQPVTTGFHVKRVICEVLFSIERVRLQLNKWCLKKGELDIIYKVLHFLLHDFLYVPSRVFLELKVLLRSLILSCLFQLRNNFKLVLFTLYRTQWIGNKTLFLVEFITT